jgi:hypothetical protein
MRVEAKARLLADEASKRKRQDADKKIDELNKQVDQVKKTLPSTLNKMKVSPANKIQKHKQILDIKNKIEDKKQEKLRYKG